MKLKLFAANLNAIFWDNTSNNPIIKISITFMHERGGILQLDKYPKSNTKNIVRVENLEKSGL